MLELTNAINQMDVTGIYRTFHLSTKQCTFFPAHNGIFSEMDHIQGHKASLNRYKKIQTAPCILSVHHGLNDSDNRRKKAYKIMEKEWLKMEGKWIRTELKTF